MSKELKEMRESSTMEVGFYTSLKNINPFRWDYFLGGKQGLSGTDGSLLRISHKLAERSNGLNVTLFTDCDFPETQYLKTCNTLSFLNTIEVAKEKGIDLLIFIHKPYDDLREALQRASESNLRLAVWAQNTPAPDLVSLYENQEALLNIICVSHNQADHQRHRPIFKKVVVIHNAINLNFFANIQSEKDLNQITYLGAVTENKGLQFLLSVWPSILKTHPQAKLKIIGSAKLYSSNQKLGLFGLGSLEFEERYIYPIYGKAENALIASNIEALGVLGPVEMNSVLKQSLIGVVNPSYNYNFSAETFCVSAVEMQACGIAVVGGNVGGLRETVLNNKTGYLINSPDELRRKLIKLLTQPQKALRFGQEGIKYATNFDIDRIILDWEVYIDSIRTERQISQKPLKWRKAEGKVWVKEILRLFRS